MILLSLLIIAGIEINPGPISSETSDDLNMSHITDLSNLIENSVSFLHLNIQSLVPKLDLITAEYSSHEIISFSETWLKSTTPDDEISFLI